MACKAIKIIQQDELPVVNPIHYLGDGSEVSRLTHSHPVETGMTESSPAQRIEACGKNIRLSVTTFPV